MIYYHIIKDLKHVLGVLKLSEKLVVLINGVHGTWMGLTENLQA